MDAPRQQTLLAGGIVMQTKPSNVGNFLLLLYAGLALLFLIAVVLDRGFGLAVPQVWKRGTFALTLIALAAALAVLLPRSGRVRLSKRVFVGTQIVSFAWWLAVLAEFAR